MADESPAAFPRPGSGSSAVMVYTLVYDDVLEVSTGEPSEDPVLAVRVRERTRLTADGATSHTPVLEVEIDGSIISFDNRDQVLRLQAIVNRAANHWRQSATAASIVAGSL